MNLKTFTAVCAMISAALVSVPQNIIGCGGSVDPYDYYLGFFNQYAASQVQYQPFFYTNQKFLFDEEEPQHPETILVQEWVGFTGKTASPADVEQLVMKAPLRDLRTLYYHIEKHQPAILADSVGRNSMARFFLKGRDLEALGYILYAKTVEPHVVAGDDWSPDTRDSILMDKLLKNGLQLYRAAKTALFQLKYAYQVVRLAHYNHHYQEAIQYYDELVAPNPTPSVLQPMSLALKAGALYRLGNQEAAAYLFSKAFYQSHVKKISNYSGFGWSVVASADRERYLARCKNQRERAEMLALFALQHSGTDLATLKEIYRLDPTAALLPTLMIREVNKYEEQYLTPLVGREYQSKLLGIGYYYRYTDEETDSVLAKERPMLANFVAFADQMAREQKVAKPALMQLSAAYGAYMLRDFEKAKAGLQRIKGKEMEPRLRDQWMLTNLLVEISSQERIDPAFEARILPSIQWLYNKARSGSAQEGDPNRLDDGTGEQHQWMRFYRNVLVDILSKRYKAKGDLNKAVLAIGSPEYLMGYGSATATEYLRDQFNGKEAEGLYQFLADKQFSPYERFLVEHNELKIKDVADFAGTAYLRDYDYDRAITWLQKVPDQNKVIEKDPFIELLFDREEQLPGDQVTTTKLKYAREMKKLHDQVATDKANAASYLYRLALGYYNVTYYGYAWNLVEYWRSGVDGYHIPANATGFQKEYYGAFTALKYFKLALEASGDKEFRAKCLYMMARCSQKQIPKPLYMDFGYNGYDLYEKATKAYYVEFMSNRYYADLKGDYEGTRFYKDALTRCSYLSDFVRE